MSVKSTQRGGGGGKVQEEKNKGTVPTKLKGDSRSGGVTRISSLLLFIRDLWHQGKQQTAVCSYAFAVSRCRDSNFSKAFIAQCRHVVFYQVEVHDFYRPQNRNNSLIRVQKFDIHIANGYKKLVRAFKPRGGGVLPPILDRGVPRRFVNPNPI